VVWWFVLEFVIMFFVIVILVFVFRKMGVSIFGVGGGK